MAAISEESPQAQQVLIFLKVHWKDLDPQTQRDLMPCFWKYQDLIGDLEHLELKHFSPWETGSPRRLRRAKARPRRPHGRPRSIRDLEDVYALVARR